MWGVGSNVCEVGSSRKRTCQKHFGGQTPTGPQQVNYHTRANLLLRVTPQVGVSAHERREVGPLFDTHG